MLHYGNQNFVFANKAGISFDNFNTELNRGIKNNEDIIYWHNDLHNFEMMKQNDDMYNKIVKLLQDYYRNEAIARVRASKTYTFGREKL